MSVKAWHIAIPPAAHRLDGSTNERDTPGLDPGAPGGADERSYMKRLVLVLIVAAVVAALAGTARAGSTGPLILPAPQALSTSSPDSFCPPTGCGGGGGSWTCYNHPAYGGYYSYAATRTTEFRRVPARRSRRPFG